MEILSFTFHQSLGSSGGEDVDPIGAHGQLTDLWSAIDPKYLDYTQEINKTVIAFKIFPISSDLISDSNLKVHQSIRLEYSKSLKIFLNKTN